MTATPAPRRALIVSADIGEGHNSAGRAVAEAIARAWPGCEVGWLDALAAMGAGFGPLYLLVIVGPLGFLLNQSALQAGQLVAPVLAVITAVDPLVSIGIAYGWLHETIAAAPLDLAAESVSLAVMTAVIIALAHRAPQAARQGLKAPAGRSEQPAINRSTI